MNTPSWNAPTTLGIVVVAVVASALIFHGCGDKRQTEADKLPPSVIKTADSLAVTKPIFQRQQDSIIRVIVVDTVAAVALRKAELRVKSSADAMGRLADSLARTASTATEWHAAYDTRTHQADSLTLALAKADSVGNAERSARQALAIAYRADTLRRNVTDKLNADLRSAIADLEKPCHLIGPIRCPSRSVSAGIGLVLGAIAEHSR